jgi:hypothetical protein
MAPQLRILEKNGSSQPPTLLFNLIQPCTALFSYVLRIFALAMQPETQVDIMLTPAQPASTQYLGWLKRVHNAHDSYRSPPQSFFYSPSIVLS